MIGLCFAFLSPAEYEARASIIPEYELQDNVSELIESYGLLFGLTGSVREEKTPSYLLELYPYMIKSLSFQQALMNEPFRYGKSKKDMTLHNYFTHRHRPGLMSSIHKYTIGLPGTIGRALRSDSVSKVQSIVAESSTADSMSSLSEQGISFKIARPAGSEKLVINQLRSRIDASYQRRTGIINIHAKMPEPELAAKTVQLVLKVLQEKVINYKTAKAQTYKKFLVGQQTNAKAELDEARQTLITFKEKDSQPLNRRMALQSQYQYALDRYGTLSEQVERINLTIQKQIPVFRVLNDISVPNQKSEPNRKLIITFSLLLGFLIALCWITFTFFTSTLTQKSAS